MKKSISTLLSFMALALFCSTTLSAQQNINTEKKDLVIVQKATTETGTVEVDKLTLEKGKKFEVYIDQLNELKMDNKDIKLEVFTSTNSTMEIQTDEETEETVFFFRAAKSADESHQDVEKLVITINKEIEELAEIEEVAEVMEATTAHPVTTKPLLGVYSEKADDGVLITNIVPRSGAQKAGLQRGDVITALNNHAVSSSDDLSKLILQHEVGESIRVNYIRDGVPAVLNATLGEKKTRAPRHFHSHYKNFDRYKKFEDRNPCDVFIGVYTSNAKNGLKVHNIIPNTPAARSDIRKGDLIMAFDDIEVNSHNTLVQERDKHQAGDLFTLSILRDGQMIEIDSEFEACPNEKAKETIIIENPTVIEETPVTELQITETLLELDDFSVFPNPTYGPVNLKFKGEAKPTTIRVIDVSGKVVYEEVINNFDGIYNNTLEFKRPTAGTMILTIQQDQKVFSQSLAFLTRV